MTRTSLVGSALGFTAGYVDTICFIALFGLFTAHVTGNFVLIGSELASHGTHVLIKLLAFPAFIAAVAASRLLAVALEGRGADVKRALLLLQILLLCACVLCNWEAQPIVGSEAAWPLATGIFAAAAMGVQNAAAKLAFSELAPTTVMTGNVTQLVIDLVDLARGAVDASMRERFHKFIWPMLAFAIGAVCGGVAYTHLPVLSLGLPLLLLSLLAVTTSDT